jgi:FAD/FMN-containing dehydrogenase
VIGSVGFAVYRANLANRLPEGLPTTVVDAAKDTLAAAVDVARQLPAADGSRLLSAARESFVEGLQTTAIVGAVLAVLLAVAAVTLLRNARMPGPAPLAEPGGGVRRDQAAAGAVDPRAGTARIGAGLRWGEVLAAAAEHGLAPVRGSSGQVGAMGYLTGGGLPLTCRTWASPQTTSAPLNWSRPTAESAPSRRPRLSNKQIAARRQTPRVEPARQARLSQQNAGSRGRAHRWNPHGKLATMSLTCPSREMRPDILATEMGRKHESASVSGFNCYKTAGKIRQVGLTLWSTKHSMYQCITSSTVTGPRSWCCTVRT